MRVSFYQFDIEFGEKKRNQKMVYGMLSDQNFDLLVLPELFTTGYSFLSKDEARTYAERIPEGESTRRMINFAAKTNAYVVGGIVERVGDKVYNSAMLVSPDGYIGKQRKVHLTKVELPIFDRGSDFTVFDLDGVKIGIVICFDIWFPEICRYLAVNNAQIICHPANFGAESTLNIARARALENKVFVITSNRIGEETRTIDAHFLGRSRIIADDGEILRQASGGDSFCVADINPLSASNKSTGFCDNLLDERKYFE